MGSITPQDFVDLYVMVLQRAIPVAFVFGMGNALVNMFFNAAFRGRLVIGAGGV